MKVIETNEDQEGYALKYTFVREILKKIQGLGLNLKIK